MYLLCTTIGIKTGNPKRDQFIYEKKTCGQSLIIVLDIKQIERRNREERVRETGLITAGKV